MKQFTVLIAMLLFSLISFQGMAQNAVISDWSEIERGRAALRLMNGNHTSKLKSHGGQNQSRMGAADVNPGKGWWNHQTPVQALVNCGPDTVEYLTYKAWVAELLPNNLYDSAYSMNVGLGSTISLGQWFPTPQPITVNAFRFIATIPQSAGNFVLSVTCNLYNAGPDSMPLGAPIKTILVNVDTSTAFRYANFIAPSATIPAGPGYVITIENNNATPAEVWFASNLATPIRCGYREWLACAQFTQFNNPWTKSYNFNVFGQPFDGDVYMHPIVQYSATAAATSSVTCFGSTTVNFTNTSSALFGSRFYNFYAFLNFIGGATPLPPITANSFGDSTYVWNFGDSSPVDTIVSPTHAFPGANPYTVVMTGRIQRWRAGAQQFCNDTWTYNIGPDPVATVVANGPTSFCMGNFVQLTTPSTAASYQWYRNGAAIPNATTGTHNANLAGVYTIKLSNSITCQDSSTVGVTVTLLPGATASISVTGPTSFCNGGSTQLTASGGTTQQWYLNGNLIPGATTANYTVLAGGSYTVKVFNSSGCPDSTIVPTIINVQAASITSTGPSAVCAGPVILTANAGVSYQWFSNNNPLPGETNQLYTANTNDSYTVAVEFASGCIDTSSTPFVLTIGPMNANITTSGPVTFCGGGTVTLAAVTQGAGTYQWYDNNVAIPNATTGSYTANASGVFTVVVISTPGPGCDDSTAVATNVTVNPAPSPGFTASGSTTICPGGSVTFTGSGGLSYQWTFGGVPIPGATGSIYTALGTSPGNYNVIVSNGPCSDTLAAPILVIDQPLVASTVQSGVYTICSNAPLLLQAMPTGSQSYVWYRNGGQVASGPFSTYLAGLPGDYTVKVSDPGCMDSTTTPITLNVNPAPTALINSSGPLQFCSGDSITLSTSGGVQYQWYVNNTIIPGANTTSIKVNSSGQYTVVVTNGIGCPDSSAAANVQVSPSPAASLNVSGPLNFCVGNNVLFTAPGTIQSGFNYAWLRNGNMINGATAPQYSANTSGTYTVVVTYGICIDTLLVGAVVQVDSLPPLAGFTPSITGSLVNYTNTSMRARVYDWHMGDGNTYNTVNVTHTYTQGGIYDVTLYALNACGIDSFKIQVLTAAEALSDALQGMELYPNPSDGIFTLRLNMPSSEILKFTVTDITGKLVYQAEETAGIGVYDRMIDLRSVTPGVYMMQLKGGDAAVYRKLIIE